MSKPTSSTVLCTQNSALFSLRATPRRALPPPRRTTVGSSPKHPELLLGCRIGECQGSSHKYASNARCCLAIDRSPSQTKGQRKNICIHVIMSGMVITHFGIKLRETAAQIIG